MASIFQFERPKLWSSSIDLKRLNLISGGKWLRRNCLVKTVDSLKLQLPRGLAILPAVKAFNQRKEELEAARI